MVVAVKRTRHKTGPNSWVNITTRSNGTSSRSSSTSVGGRTTNISSKGVTRTVNNNGWVTKSRIPAWPKPKKSSKKSSRDTSYLWKNLFGGSKKKPAKKKPVPKTYTALPEIDVQPREHRPEIEFTGTEKFIGIVIISIVCVVVQLMMR